MFDLTDVLSYLLHEEQVDVLPVTNVKHACESIYSLTKIVAGWVYRQSKTSEFDAKQKYNTLIG